MTARPWKRSDVTTELLCWAIHCHGVEALDHLNVFLGIPPKVLVAAVLRDTRHGYITWGVTVWRPLLDWRGIAFVRTTLTALEGRGCRNGRNGAA